MSKKLNEDALQSELSEGSAFFQEADQNAGLNPTKAMLSQDSGATAESERQQTSELDSRLARKQAIVVETIRRTVKVQGKEVSFIRMTPEEKAVLADIVYTYKRQGLKTSENEVNRIAVNFMLEDYKANGANSLLAKVLEALAA